MSLLKSQVTELQVDNAKIDQAKSTMMQSTAIKEHNPQASSDSRGLEDKKDSMEETRKEEMTACNKELMADQGVDDAITKSITNASCSQPQTSVATNIPSKPTPSTWIKFEVIGKSGVRIPCMALLDLGEEKSFMSYGTWVISGQPTLDKDHKTLQACGKSMEECFGMAKSVIHINSQPLEGEFYVMGKKYLQKDLVLGRHLAKKAICLQYSHAMQEECQQEGKTKYGNTKQGTKMTRTNPIKDGFIELDKNREMHKEK